MYFFINIRDQKMAFITRALTKQNARGNFQFQNPYLEQGVILTPISDEIQTDPNLEPQMVRIRAQNNGNLFIDSSKRESFLSNNIPTKVVLGGGEKNNIFLTKIVRLSVTGIGINFITPNVNRTNNVVIFLSSNTGAVEHTVIVPEGFYQTRLDLMNALVVALNTATGASGLAFSHVIPTINPLITNLASAGGSYLFFVPTSGPIQSAIERGKQLWNLPIEQILSTSKIVGAINLMYTRYIDIQSRALTRHTKNPKTSNSGGATNLLFRLFLPAPPQGPPLGFVGGFTVANPTWINFSRSQSITSVDFTIVDEFGDELFVPQYAEGTDSGFYWDLILDTQI